MSDATVQRRARIRLRAAMDVLARCVSTRVASCSDSSSLEIQPKGFRTTVAVLSGAAHASSADARMVMDAIAAIVAVAGVVRIGRAK